MEKLPVKDTFKGPGSWFTGDVYGSPIYSGTDPSRMSATLVRFTPGAGFGPDDAVEIILDASGSMLQRQNGERRIEIARRTLARLVADTIPAGTGFALRVFGNREADAAPILRSPLARLTWPRHRR